MAPASEQKLKALARAPFYLFPFLMFLDSCFLLYNGMRKQYWDGSASDRLNESTDGINILFLENEPRKFLYSNNNRLNIFFKYFISLI